MNVAEWTGCPLVGSRDTFLAGLECEIESVRNGGNSIGYFNCIKDGSLRNNGWEYVSVQPRTRQELVDDFTQLHKYLVFYPDFDPYSIRTSTHVHINCSCLPLEHVRNIVLLYALFEEFFFAMVKPVRRDNIHCVPLTETYLPKIYSGNLEQFHEQWHKYTALNLKRLTDLGTLEFRHLHGTGDVEEVDTWLRVLENIWKLGQEVQINQESLQSQATIEDWFTKIFGHVPHIMALKPQLFNIIRNTLIDVKFSV
jgi:hypothetical protein